MIYFSCVFTIYLWIFFILNILFFHFMNHRISNVKLYRLIIVLFNYGRFFICLMVNNYKQFYYYINIKFWNINYNILWLHICSEFLSGKSFCMHNYSEDKISNKKKNLFIGIFKSIQKCYTFNVVENILLENWYFRRLETFKKCIIESCLEFPNFIHWRNHIITTIITLLLFETQ